MSFSHALMAGASAGKGSLHRRTRNLRHTRAGIAVDVLFFPLDTLKTRLQAKEGFVRAGGFRGIYKGLGSVVVGSAPGGERSACAADLGSSLLRTAAFFFTSYEHLKKTLPRIVPALQTEQNAPLVHMFAASGGEAVRVLSC
jgi:solute carrier family 25 S-adenosylmethionine transporter 26